MSYPWWRFKLTLRKGIQQTEDTLELDWTATGLDPQDAMMELLRDFDRGFGDANEYIEQGWRVASIQYVHCDTFGIDPESDAILLAENPELRRDVLFEDADDEAQSSD